MGDVVGGGNGAIAFSPQEKMVKLKSCYEKVFGTPEGLMVLEDILTAGRCSNHTFVRGDPYETSFRCGEQAMGHYIRHMAQDSILELNSLEKRFAYNYGGDEENE